MFDINTGSLLTISVTTAKKFEHKSKNSLFLAPLSLDVRGMDTSTCSLGNQIASQTSAQRKFYQWVLKWINGVHAHTETNGDELRDIRHLTKPDVPTFASLLQAIGFKLLSFEKQNEPLISKKNESNIENKTEPGVVRIAIECDNSKMRAVLELEGTACQCPNPDHIKDASFWSISGTGPVGSTDNIAHKIEETGSNLLPRLSKDVSRLLRDVSYKLFDTIAYEPDVNRNTDVSLNISRTNSLSCEPKATQDNMKKEIGVTRSYTQPEIRFRNSSVSSKCAIEKQQKTTNNDASVNRAMSPVPQNKPILQRQRTWDIDIETGSLDDEPRPSPPKLTSSPAVVTELSQSLSQISLQSEIETPRNVTEYILGAQQNLEKALKMLLFKKPLISNELSPNQDHENASVKSAPANISPTTIISPYKTTRSKTISNARPSSKLSHLPHEQHSQLKTNLSQTPKARRSIETTLSKPLTRRSMQLEQENSKSMVRRSSFYFPSSTNSSISLLSKSSDVGQQFFGSGKYNTSKTNLMVDSDFPTRDLSSRKKITSPEQQIGTSQNFEQRNTTTNRRSLIKPPTKISKSIPVKIKPVQPTKIGTPITKKPRG